MEKKEYTREELRLLAAVLPNVGMEMRSTMANMYTIFNRVAPKKARENDEKLDINAAYFLQSYYRMNRLASNLSDAAMLGHDRRFTLLNADIVYVAQEVCEKAEPLFELEGVTLRFESNSDGQIIAMDSGLMERLLLNLLSNALKFTPEGGTVTVRVRVTDTQVFLSVADTGEGMSPEKKAGLFTRSLETESFSAPSGMGLGLVICQRIARGHGGTIAVESKKGKGTVITVSLPNARSDNLIFREPRMEYAGGFDQTKMELADALSIKAFTSRNML